MTEHNRWRRVYAVKGCESCLTNGKPDPNIGRRSQCLTYKNACMLMATMTPAAAVVKYELF